MRGFSDGDQLHGPEVTAVFREALEEATAVLDGCAPSAGSGTREVDVDSGTVVTSNTEYSIDSSTVTLSDDPGFDRYDLVVVDSDGSLTDITGSEERVAPDLPSQNVLISVVFVSGDSNDVEDVRDSRALLAEGYFDVLKATTMTPDAVEADEVIAFDRLRAPRLSSDPSSPDSGEFWYRSDLD